MKHKALKKIEGGKSTQKVNIQKQKIKVQKLHLELLEFCYQLFRQSIIQINRYR